MDLKLNYDLLKNIYKELGKDKFFKIFAETYKKFNLYTMSQAWIESREYILKFKGINGDIVVYWL